MDLIYDHAGRLSSVTAEGQTTFYGYEKNRLKSRTDPAGVSSFSYDLDGMLQKIVDPFGTQTLYDYDNLGRILTRDFGPGSLPDITTAWTYDGASRVDTQITEDVTVDLGYDKSSNVTSKTMTGPFAPGEEGTWTYTYSPDNKLESAKDPGGTTSNYGYDGAGNRTSVKVGNAPAVTTSYDAAGHPDSASDGTDYTTDATGALTEVRTGGLPPPLGEVTTYDYDTWGRLGEVTDPEGLPTTYSYDALERTISRTDALGEASYLYAGNSHDLVSEQVTLAGAGGTTSRKVALSPEGPLAIRSTDALGAVVTRYPLADPHGDVIGLFRNERDLTGTRTYSPWGEVRAATGDAAVSPFGFQGDWTDPGTGHVDMGARMYEPNLGRFITRDSWPGDTTSPLTLNQFTYVVDNPLSQSDPTGMCPPSNPMCPSAENQGLGGNPNKGVDAVFSNHEPSPLQSEPPAAPYDVLVARAAASSSNDEMLQLAMEACRKELLGSNQYNICIAEFGNDTSIARAATPCLDCPSLGEVLGSAAKSAWHALRAAVNSGQSLLALLYAGAVGADCRRAPELMTVCTVSEGWMDGPRGGITIGNVYISTQRPDSDLLRHETRHADQWAVVTTLLGPLGMPLLYGVAEIPSQIGGDPCLNAFEFLAGCAEGGYG